jgi:hypothetical protein
MDERLNQRILYDVVQFSHCAYAETTYVLDDRRIGTHQTFNPIAAAMVNSSPSPSVEKRTLAQHEKVEHAKRSEKEEMERIDALATAPETTLATFAHLDEKKILRKMDLRLIPILAVLYLLAFLDRGV